MMGLLQAMAAAGRTILFSSHILEEVERLADSILVVYAGRLAAAGDFRSIRRLMTDRPHTFRVRSSDDRRLAAALLGHPGVFGVELSGERLSIRTSDFGGVHPGAAARSRGNAASRSSRSARPTIRSRASSATWSADDRRSPPSSRSPLRGLLGRRRLLLMLALASIPVLLGAVRPGPRRSRGRGAGARRSSSSRRSCRSSR